MNKVKAIPNTLSVGRIILSLCLLFVDTRFPFAACYLLCGITDVLDGYIARKYRLQTTLGAKLDSLGDFIFWLIVLFLLYVRTEIYTLPVLLGVGVIALFKMVNFVITKLKFNQWGMLHSVGNKVIGLVLYFICLAAFLLNTLEWYLWAIVFSLALLASVEELYILWHSKHYNPNPKGLFKTSN